MARLEFTDGREIYVDEDKMIAEIEEGEAEYGRDIVQYDPFVNPGDEITTADVDAALRIARIRAVKPADIKRAVRRKKAVAEALPKIEYRADLFSLNEAETLELIDGPLRELITSLAEVKGVDVAMASKILHLKRPALVPILDRYVYSFYSYIYHAGKKARNVETAVRLLKEMRDDGLVNLNVLTALAEHMSDAANAKLPPGRKVALTPARALDRVIWRHIKKRTG
jgi:pentatricopeptide repeat protein